MSWELERHPENGCFTVYAKATGPQIFQIRPTTFSSTTSLTLRHPDGPEPAVPGTLSRLTCRSQIKLRNLCTSDRSQHLLLTHRNWARAPLSIDIPLVATAGSPAPPDKNIPPKPALPKS
jgi:hypothetical protein